MVTEKKPRFSEDIVDDVLRRVIEMAPGFSAALAAQIANEVRHEWAGEKTHICFIARRDAEVRSQRNEAIVRDYLQGERIALLERRYQLTGRRILQIIKGR